MSLMLMFFFFSTHNAAYKTWSRGSRPSRLLVLTLAGPTFVSPNCS